MRQTTFFGLGMINSRNSPMSQEKSRGNDPKSSFQLKSFHDIVQPRNDCNIFVLSGKRMNSYRGRLRMLSRHMRMRHNDVEMIKDIYCPKVSAIWMLLEKFVRLTNR